MIQRILTWLVPLCLLGTVSAVAQDKKDADKPLSGDAMIYKYLCAEADKLSGKFLDGAKTLEEWQKKRPRLHEEYLDMLGLWPLPEKTPLKATITGTLQHEGVIMDKLHFQSKPGLYVTANLYRPKNPPANKLPAIVYVCGHANRGRDGNKSAFQDHGMWFASNGYVCIILDSLQLGEIKGIHHGTYGLRETKPVEVRWWWHSAGYTPAGVECWNGVRAIDYLVSRADVDAERIGVTGISGGGAATFWITAADERVKVAVPVSGMSDLQCYVKDKIINGHCDCLFLYNTYQWDWTTIAALVAPRPMLFANSDNDKIFPMDANRRVFEKLRKVYTMYGKAELVDEYISKGPHDYRPDLRVAAFRFLNKHLKNDTTTPVKDADFKPIPAKELRAFPTDADIPKDALNGKIDETFVPRAKVTLPEKEKFEEWKTAILKQLRDSTFRSIVEGVAAAKREKKFIEIDGKKEWYMQTLTEPGIEVDAGPVLKSGEIKFLYVVEQESLQDKTREAELKRVLGGKNHWYLLPRGFWTNPSPPNYVDRAHALLGQTPDLGRVRDIIATFKCLQEQEKVTPAVVGVGSSAILVVYAALLEPSIKEIVVIDPPKSHTNGPHFLEVLRVLDIPVALGLLAPTPLTLLNAKDLAFDRTAEIYMRAGAADKLTRR
jgi:dienelactone hydrolase